MAAVYAGHYTDPPRDATGKAIPNATFQLYIIGTKNSPTYYTDRTKAIVLPGDPTSDSFGNVSIWPEPGIYEYWYQGQFIQLITVEEDDDEDNAAIAAAVETINGNLNTNYYTKTQVDAAIAANGAPGVGSELTANKNQPNGYAGLNGSGIVADAQLPTNLERTTNKNQNSGYCGLDSGGHVAQAQLDVGRLLGTHVVLVNSNYNANYGDFIVADTSGGTFTITLPTPAADKPPISINLEVGGNTLNLSGNIKGSVTTVGFTLVGATHEFVSDASTFRYKSAYFPLNVLARLDVDNDFGNHQLTNYKDKVVTVSTSTYTAGTDGWNIRLRWTNAGGGTLTLPNNATIGDSIIVHQAGAGQITISSASGASFSEPDGLSKTAKQTAAVVITCIRNDSGTSAVYVVGGYTGS